MINLSRGRHWVQFATITVLMALPLLVGYLFMLRQVERVEYERHSARLQDRLDLWQERLAVLLDRLRADTGDAAALLGVVEDGWLLGNTLKWYGNPEGGNLLEGMAVLDGDGSLRPGRYNALLDGQGRPQSRQALDSREKASPWLRNPWLADYTFITRALDADRKLDFFLSPFIFAPGRQVLVAASPRRDPAGRLEAAVLAQTSAGALVGRLVGEKPGLEHLWLTDRQGRVGYASTPLARASAERWAAARSFDGPDGTKAAAPGPSPAAPKAPGAGERAGVEPQEIDGLKVQVSFRRLAGDLVVGAVETQESLALVGRGPLRTFGAAGVMSLILLILAGLAYTTASLRRESRSVRTDTLRRYTGTISHRVRNDLVTLRGQTELIASGLVTDLDRIQEVMSKDMDAAIGDIERTVRELEGLSRGELKLEHDAQAGRETLYRVNQDPARKEQR